MPASPCSNSLPQGQALPPGTRLEEFVIEKVLGSGGFGITYLARDSQLGRQVVIKENLPAQFCFRDPSSLTVSPRHSQGEDAENFAYSLASFEQEAMTLASLDHPGIVKVLRRFEAFGTAYFVMPFVEGAALDDLLKQGKHFGQQELQELLQRLLSALGYLHERGIYHRDIKPGNILISAATGEPVLIDFGAARQRLGEKSLTVIESAGYTPFEQLQTRGKVGPWSDIYALGATLYKVLTGETPAKAADRVLEDPLVSLSQRAELRGLYSEAMLSGVDRALAPRSAERFQEAGEWMKWLEAGGTRPVVSGPPPLPVKKPATVPPPVSCAKPATKAFTKSQKEMLIAAGLVLFVLIAMAWIIRGGSSSGPDPIVADPTQSPEPVPVPQSESMPDLQARPPESAPVARREVTPEATPTLPASVAPFATVSKNTPFQNSLGMGFVPAGTPGVLFSVWETRVQDFATFVEATGHDAISENSFGFKASTLEKTASGSPGWEQKGGSWRDPRFLTLQSPEHPVVCVSYLDAEAFCDWLTKSERASGKIPATASYRLPSDSEWSRAVDGSEFPWGDHFPPTGTDGNYKGQEAMIGVLEGYGNDLAKAGLRDNAARTALVGLFKANRFGLYDMGGNVAEWCSTWYTADLNDEDAKKAIPSLSDDQGGQNYRILRGASWSDGDRLFLRSSCRYYGRPVVRDVSFGFRIVLAMVGAANEADEPPSKTPAPAPAAETDSLLDQGAVGKVVEGMLPGEISIKFVFCPPGSFLMGSPRSEEGRHSDEEQVQVQISQGFWLSQTEVSQRQWAALMSSNPSYFKGDDLPVEQVSWEDAQAFLAKLNDKKIVPEGWKFALPTEAQWEYACRAGERGPYSGGSLDEVGWYDGNSRSQTREVGQKKPNAWGLYDMHGNVLEWCADWYDDTLKGGVDPTGPLSGGRRVCRGGSWRLDASGCRAALRDRYYPGYRLNDRLGFRPVLVPSR